MSFLELSYYKFLRIFEKPRDPNPTRSTRYLALEWMFGMDPYQVKIMMVLAIPTLIWVGFFELRGGDFLVGFWALVNGPRFHPNCFSTDRGEGSVPFPVFLTRRQLAQEKPRKAGLDFSRASLGCVAG